MSSHSSEYFLLRQEGKKIRCHCQILSAHNAKIKIKKTKNGGMDDQIKAKMQAAAGIFGRHGGRWGRLDGNESENGLQANQSILFLLLQTPTSQVGHGQAMLQAQATCYAWPWQRERRFGLLGIIEPCPNMSYIIPTHVGSPLLPRVPLP